VELDFEIGDVDSIAGQPGLRKIVVTNLELRVDTRSVASGEDWRLETPGAYRTEFHLRERSAGGDSGAYWTMVRWVDMPPSWAKTTQSSWGAIKGLFFEPPPDLPRQPADALRQLERAYEAFDSTAYAALLDPGFIFQFDPRDIGPGTGYREWLTRADDLRSTRRMFRGDPSNDDKRLVARSAVVDFELGEPDTVAGQPGWRKIGARSVALRVDCRSQVNGEEWWLEVPGGYETWFYLKESSIPGDAGTYWTIVRWIDKPPADAKVETKSWGSIKSKFF